MKKYLNRYPVNSKKIYFKKGKNIISKNKGIFLKKYKAHHCIKFLSSDFKLIKKNMNRLTHFNIQHTGHKPGKNYLLVKIDKRWYFDGKIFKQPILSNNNFIIAKCLFVKNNIDYANLKDKFFRHSLSNTKNINNLKKTIKRRYKKSLAHLSDTKKLSLGVAITELKIVKRL